MQERKRKALPQATIIERKEITSDLWIMWLKPDQQFKFKPGQYCTIGSDGVERAYSIASAPHEEHLELFVELVPLEEGGVLTPLLYELFQGERVTIRPTSKGVFTFSPKFENHIMVATVTGIAPYISIIRDFIKNGIDGYKFYILYGASFVDELTYDSELHEIAEKYSNSIKFIPTISRPDDPRNINWTGEKGRVNSIVEKYIREFGLKNDNSTIYVCGHPGMIESVKEEFQPQGFSVLEERFWKE